VLAARAEAWFDAEKIPSHARHLVHTIDMRYAGQNYELPITVPAAAVVAATSRARREGDPSFVAADGKTATTSDGSAPLKALADAFAAAHQQLYGFTASDEPVQLVTFRVEASAIVPKATFAAHRDAGPDPAKAIAGHRKIWLPEAGGFAECPIYDRSGLQAGNEIPGPAVIEQMDATTVVLPGMTARVEPYLNLILEAG
jgi:N-methylhydantoinase A